jgi:hypothetical protein
MVRHHVSTAGFQGDSYPSAAQDSKPKDPLCCNSTRTMQPFSSAGDDFVLVNGGLQPKIRMQASLLGLMMVPSG